MPLNRKETITITATEIYVKWKEIFTLRILKTF